MRVAHLALMGLVALSLFACRSEADHGHDHGESSHGHGHEHASGGHGDDHGDDHGHGPENHSVTRFGERTQLFVEFAPMVAGTKGSFAVHLTELAGHRSVSEGVVAVVLGNGPEAPRFALDKATKPGIWRVEVTPPSPGTYDLQVELVQGELREVHALGPWAVHADAKAAAQAMAHPEGDHDHAEGAESIGYTLEQQWQVEFGLAKAETRPVRPSFAAFGRLVRPPGNEALVLAPADGRLLLAGSPDEEAGSLVGRSVDKGQALFALVSAPKEGADPATLDAQVARTAIEVEAARREQQRAQTLLAQGLVPARRLEDAERALADALALQSAAKKQLAAFEAAQKPGAGAGRVRVASPLTGTIAELLATPGSYVTAGQPLVRVTSSRGMWLEVGVPEAHAPRLGEVAGVWFKPHAEAAAILLEKEALATVAPAIDPATRTLAVRFKIAQPDPALVPGATVTAHILGGGAREAVAIPFSAIVDDGGTPVVYVASEGEAFERRVVRLGARELDVVEVLSGVSADAWVVARGGYYVRMAAGSTESIGHGHAH